MMMSAKDLQRQQPAEQRSTLAAPLPLSRRDQEHLARAHEKISGVMERDRFAARIRRS